MFTKNYLTLILSSTFFFITHRAALSQEDFPNYQYLRPHSSISNRPVCYMETVNNTIMDLTNLCIKKSEPARQQTSSINYLNDPKLTLRESLLRICKNVNPKRMGATIKEKCKKISN